MGFQMKKPSMIEGTAAHKKATKKRYEELQVNRDMEQNMPDGRSMSSPFQKKEGNITKQQQLQNDRLNPSTSWTQKKKAVKHGEKHGDDPGYQSYLDKTMGGKTEVKDGKSYTAKPAPTKKADPTGVDPKPEKKTKPARKAPRGDKAEQKGEKKSRSRKIKAFLHGGEEKLQKKEEIGEAKRNRSKRRKEARHANRLAKINKPTRAEKKASRRTKEAALTSNKVGELD